jgi:hypothetical protein
MNDNAHAKTPVRRGRKPMNKAKRDFLVADAREEYETLRKKYRAQPGQLPPHEAAAEAMQATRKALGHIGSKRLKNELSEFKKIAVSPAEEIAPDLYDPPDHIRNPRRRR